MFEKPEGQDDEMMTDPSKPDGPVEDEGYVHVQDGAGENDLVLKREPRGWPDPVYETKEIKDPDTGEVVETKRVNVGRPEIADVWFNDQVPEHTSCVVIDVEGGVWVGSAKRHPDDPESTRIGHLLALQRAQRQAGLTQLLREVPEGRREEILRHV